jgi:flagellar biosynthesis protein FlhG
MNCGTLTASDLLDTVKSQQYEINRLKKENQLLKAKIVNAINQGFRV